MKYDWLLVSLDMVSHTLVTITWYSGKAHVKTEDITDFSVPQEALDRYASWERQIAARNQAEGEFDHVAGFK